MDDKPIVLLVEDNEDDASDYRQDIEALIDVTVITVFPPPPDLLDLAALVNEHNVGAVILDERLQQSSDATYVGVDAFDFLRSAFPRLPVDILTNYPHSPELKGHGLHAENLVRKRDLDDDEIFRESYLQELYRRARRYHREQGERHRLIPASYAVTEEFVESLARLHFEADRAIEQIVWVRSSEERQICLIEVSRTALPAESIQVFRFAPSEDVPFPVLIADLRPTEWERIRRDDIPLPEGWTLVGAHIFRRSEVLPEGWDDVG